MTIFINLVSLKNKTERGITTLIFDKPYESYDLQIINCHGKIISRDLTS